MSLIQRCLSLASTGIVVIGFGTLALGCAGFGSGPAVTGSSFQTSGVEGETDALLPVSALRDDLLLRQTVTIRWEEGEETFDAVLQKRGDELLLLGLGPMNAVGFRLRLNDEGVHFENRSGLEMPFDPRRILADVQRVFYPWIEVGTGADADCRRCEQSAILAGMKIVEVVGAEALEERRFESTNPDRPGRIVVRFEEWMDELSIPRHAFLRNERHGYDLVIDTKSAERIE